MASVVLMPNGAVLESWYIYSKTSSYSSASRSSLARARPVTIRKNRLHILERISATISAMAGNRVEEPNVIGTVYMSMQTGDFSYHKDEEKTADNRIGKF